MSRVFQTLSIAQSTGGTDILVSDSVHILNACILER